MEWAGNQDMLPPTLSSKGRIVNRPICALDVMEVAATPGSKPTLPFNNSVFLSMLCNVTEVYFSHL